MTEQLFAISEAELRKRARALADRVDGLARVETRAARAEVAECKHAYVRIVNELRKRRGEVT